MTWMLGACRRLLAVAIAGLCLALGAAGAQAQTPSTWEAIKSRGSLRIGVTQAPPWFLKDPAKGTWSGLGNSIGAAMAKALGVKLEQVEVTWGTAIAALQADKIDIMFVLDATPERAMAVDFPSQPLLFYALAVLAKDDLKIETWSDLNSDKLRIAVPQGTTMDSYVTTHASKATILRFPSNGEAVAAFQAGRADVVSLFHPPLISMRQQIGKGKIVLPKPVRESASSAAVRRETDKTWRDWVSTTIAYYYTTGQTQAWYEEALKEFGVDPASVPAIRRENW